MDEVIRIMTLEKLLKTREPAFWGMRGRGLQPRHLQRYLDEGGDIHAKGPQGWTLLHYAAEDQSIACISLLVSRGADVNAREAHRGYTPLHLAVDSDCDTSSREGRRSDRLATVRALIEAGADESIRSDDGKTPRDFAIAYGSRETALYDAVSRLHRARCDLAGIPSHWLTGVTPEAIDPMLTEWRWTLGDDSRALFLTAAGDVFLLDWHGRVLWLNTGAGILALVSGSLAEFESALSNSEQREDWFFAPVVERLGQAGQVLAPGQCFGFAMLPVLGGEWEGVNRIPVSAQEHLSLTGYLHHQIKDLPEGAPVHLTFVD